MEFLLGGLIAAQLAAGWLLWRLLRGVSRVRCRIALEGARRRTDHESLRENQQDLAARVCRLESIAIRQSRNHRFTGATRNEALAQLRRGVEPAVVAKRFSLTEAETSLLLAAHKLSAREPLERRPSDEPPTTEAAPANPRADERTALAQAPRAPAKLEAQ